MSLHFIKHRILDKLIAKKRATANIRDHSINSTIVDNYFNAIPPLKNELLGACKLVAVDFETTGLKKNDQIISMGFCPLNDFKIRLTDCNHLIVNPEIALSHESVKIHGITDDKVNTGVTSETALEKFLTLAKGAIIIAHYHEIERQFIQTLAKKVLGETLPLTFIDTLWIAKQRMQRRNQTISPGALRLFNLRKEFGLPDYNAHNALEDAIATAELFLAQTATMKSDLNKIRLRELKLFRYRS